VGRSGEGGWKKEERDAAEGGGVGWDKERGERGMSTGGREGGRDVGRLIKRRVGVYGGSV